MLFNLDIFTTWHRINSRLGSALLRRLPFEERSMHRHNILKEQKLNPGKDQSEPTLTATQRAAREFDTWFGYSRVEMAIRWVVEAVNNFDSHYIQANSQNAHNAPDPPEVPSPYSKQRESASVSSADLFAIHMLMQTQGLSMEEAEKALSA